MSSEPPGFGRSARERRAHSKHVYEGTEVLRNRADIRDQSRLDLFERRMVTLASRRRAALPHFTYDSFKGLHRTLFGDVYEWAGQIRDYPTGRGSAPFCLPEFIDANMERIFAQLAARDELRNLTADEFADRAAHQ